MQTVEMARLRVATTYRLCKCVYSRCHRRRRRHSSKNGPQQDVCVLQNPLYETAKLVALHEEKITRAFSSCAVFAIEPPDADQVGVGAGKSHLYRENPVDFLSVSSARVCLPSHLFFNVQASEFGTQVKMGQRFKLRHIGSNDHVSFDPMETSAPLFLKSHAADRCDSKD